jgi:phosphosulfolactate synthase (CoM biosynthesis protein A)
MLLLRVRLVESYIRECKDLGFDIVEVSCGFITIPMDDRLRLVEKCSPGTSRTMAGR